MSTLSAIQRSFNELSSSISTGERLRNEQVQAKLIRMKVILKCLELSLKPDCQKVLRTEEYKNTG